jgi:amino acid transporter
MEEPGFGISSSDALQGALYYWAFRLGGPRWGAFASWTAGWCNLVGQIAGVASGAYAGAELLANIVQLATPDLPQLDRSVIHSVS